MTALSAFAPSLAEQVKGRRQSALHYTMQAARHAQTVAGLLQRPETGPDLALVEHELLEALRAVTTAQIAQAGERALLAGRTLSDGDIEVLTERARIKRERATIELRRKAAGRAA